MGVVARGGSAISQQEKLGGGASLGCSSQAESGKRKVTLKHPHVMPIMKLATSPDTRRRVNFACETR